MRKRSILLIFLSCLGMLLLLGGCQTDKKESDHKDNEKGTAVYFTDKDCTKLVRENREVPLKDNQQQNVELLLDEMRKLPDGSDYRLAIPEQVIINNVTVFNNMVQVDFSTGYKKIEENEDLVCRAAIVYTLTQQKGISYVSFSISGKPMLDTDGTAIGAMNKDSFVFGELPMKSE